MRARLKRIHSSDVCDLKNYKPEKPDSFGFSVQAMVGPEGEEGEESFEIEVCTPKWLEENYGMEEVILGRHHLIVREYNYERLVRKIERFVHGCSGESWREVGEKVARLGFWEFEDYVG